MRKLELEPNDLSVRGTIPPNHGLPESDHVKGNSGTGHSSAAPLTNMFIL